MGMASENHRIVVEGEAMKSHYNKDYFNYQKRIGEFGGKANLFKFSPYISENDSVIDFGCGGGFLLKHIKCGKKRGIEINPVARRISRENGIQTSPSISSIPDNWADIIISNHALEHVANPLETIMSLHNKMKSGGKIIFVVPHERKGKYRPEDINQHLYTWTPLNLGNLFKKAGFRILEVEWIKSAWPPLHCQLYRLFGPRLFLFISHIYAVVFRRPYQVRIIAIR